MIKEGARQPGALPKHENPYFPKPVKHTGKKILYTSGGVLIFLVIAFILLSLLFFRNKNNYVRAATFTGNNRLSDQTLVESINEHLSGNYLLLVPKKNIYALRTRSLEKFLSDRFGLTQVHIDKIYPERIIHVQLTEPPIQYTTTIGGDTYFLASDGTILENITANINSYSHLFNIRVPQETVIPADEDHTHERISIDLINVANQIGSQNLQIEDDIHITGIEASANSSNDIKVLTDDSWYIYIDKSQDVTEQISNARSVYTQKIKGSDSVNTLHYIDVRVPGKAYYL